jgi:antitoxin CptB
MDALENAAEDAEFRRIRWRCRRGRLENDIVLERFLDRHGPDLRGERMRAFRALLEYNDNDLWDLLSGRAECHDRAMDEVIELLRMC